MSSIITIIVVIMIVLSVRRGLKNGLIMEAKRILVPIVSFVVSFIASPILTLFFNANGTFDNLAESALKSLNSPQIPSSVGNLILKMGGFTAPRLLMPIISHIICFVLISVVLTFVFKSLDIATKFPIVNQLNYTLGGVAGLFIAIIRIWFIIAFLRMLTFEGSMAQLYNEILKAPIASWFATHNPIIDYAIGLVEAFEIDV